MHLGQRCQCLIQVHWIPFYKGLQFFIECERNLFIVFLALRCFMTRYRNNFYAQQWCMGFSACFLRKDFISSLKKTLRWNATHCAEVHASVKVCSQEEKSQKSKYCNKPNNTLDCQFIFTPLNIDTDIQGENTCCKKEAVLLLNDTVFTIPLW